MKKYKIYKTKDCDAWSEQAVVFPEGKDLKEVFAEENMREVFSDSYGDKEAYPLFEIKFDTWCISVMIYRKGEDQEYEADICLDLVEMSEAFIID